MKNEIEKETERLSDQIRHWAETLGIPIDDVNQNTRNWFEYISNSDDPQLSESVDFVNSTVFSDVCNDPKILVLWLYAAARELLFVRQSGLDDATRWSLLIRAAESISQVSGYAYGVVSKLEAIKQERSESGKKGAQSKHQLTKKLKVWAVEKAQTLRGADMEISRRLVLDMPDELVNVSKNPERAIYEAIRAARKVES